MGAFTTIVLRLRAPILIAVGVITALLAYRLPTLHQDEDVLKFLPEDDPDIQLFRQVSSEFGGLDVAIVGVESDRLLSADGLNAMRRMTRAASAVEGVHHALSFTEVPHLSPTEYEFTIDPIVPEDVPRDRESLLRIREVVLNDALVAGRLVSNDGNAAMILCFISAQGGHEGVAEAIREAVTEESGHMHLYFGGLPFIQSHIGGGTRRDIIRLTPYVLLLAALATFLFFRRPLGALLVLSAVALGTVWTIGGMAAMGAPMTVVSTSLPIVLVAIGGAYGAHVLAAFYVARAESAAERVEIALREVGPPVVASMLTTVAGFASFLAMDVAPMRAFGFQASVGVFLCALLSLVVVPAVLSFGRGKPIRPPAEKLGKPIETLALAARRHRWITLAVVAIVGAVAGATAWSVAPDTSLESFFRPGSEPAESDRFLRERFGGSLFIQVYMQSDLRDPVILDELRSIAEEAETLEGVTDVNSFLETLETLAAGLGGVPRLPRTHDQVTGLRPFMAGNPALRQLVDDEMTRAIVHMTVGTQDTRVLGDIVDRLRAFVDERIPARVIPVDIHQDSGRHVEEARAQRLKNIAARVERLTRGEGDAPNPAAEKAVHEVLRHRFGTWSLDRGDDLRRAVVDEVTGYFSSDDSPFDPFDGRDVGNKLTAITRRPVTVERLEGVLPAALPAELAEDEEGVELAVPAVVDRLNEARSKVVADRLLPHVVEATGLDSVDERTSKAVRQALEELDDARVGLPTDGNSGIHLEVGVTGTPVINRAFGRSTQRNQVRSIVISLIALLLLGAAMFRSPRLGLIAVFPAAFTLLINFGIMGWMGVPLDPGTCMVAALALGIGIDYAIHFLWRRCWRGFSLEETARKVGPAILFNAVQVASGFAVMIAADTVPLSRFGILVMVAMLVAAIVSFTVLPAFDRRDKATP